jgi:hypothetical protein
MPAGLLGSVVNVERGLEFGWWDVAAVLVQAPTTALTPVSRSGSSASGVPAHDLGHDRATGHAKLGGDRRSRLVVVADLLSAHRCARSVSTTHGAIASCCSVQIFLSHSAYRH